MTTFKSQINIDAPVEDVWKVLADFGNISVFNAGVSESRTINNIQSGHGAERRCDLGSPGVFILERIVEWNDGEDFTLDIYDGEKVPPFKHASTRFAVAPVGTGTLVSVEMKYGLKGGPLGWLLDRLVVSRKLGQAIPGILAGLKLHVETGVQVTETTELELAAVQPLAA